MTPESQRIAIAIANGYTCEEQGQCGQFIVWLFREPNSPDWRRGSTCSREAAIGSLPDYLTDLNAMHKVEKTLTLPQWRRYVDILGACDSNARIGNWQFVCHATAVERAKAFLKAKELWVEDTL